MSYTPPAGTAADLIFTGAAYTLRSGTSADLAWAPDVPTVTIAAAVPVIADMALEHDQVAIDIDVAATVPLVASMDVTVERYELKGEVRVAGMLVDRRVRAYLRSSGALLAEADTTAGLFVIPMGFTQQECYVTPIDLGTDATDWQPPTANRVLSALVSDT